MSSLHKLPIPLHVAGEGISPITGNRKLYVNAGQLFHDAFLLSVSNKTTVDHEREAHSPAAFDETWHDVDDDDDDDADNE